MLDSQLPYPNSDSDGVCWHASSDSMEGQLPKPSKITASFSLQDSHHSTVEDQEEDNYNSLNQVCKYFKTEFSSGRALGAHMPAQGFHSFISSSESSRDKELVSSSGRQASHVSFLHEKESISKHAVSTSTFHEHSPASSLHHSRENHPGSTRSTDQFFRTKSVSLSDGDPSNQREDDGEASAKESGSSLASYSDFDAVEYGSGKELSFPERAHQLYTLRRNPKPSKRFEDQNYAMEILASTSRKFVNSIDKGYGCRECGREFGSSKALFGHMRCHPDREWRGIHRPKRDHFVDSDHKSSSGSEWQNSASHPMIQSNSDNKSDAESIDAHLSEEFNPNLQMWTTGKRSKRSRVTVSPLQTGIARQSELEVSNTAAEAEENRYMVDCLVMLAYAGKVQEELDQARKCAGAGVWDRSKSKKAEFENGDPQSEGNTDWNRSNNSLDIQREEIRQFEGFFGEASEDHETMELPITGDDDDDDDVEGEAKPKYECSSCMKVFKSHQALGGHRASHRKIKGCYAKAHAFGWGAEGPQEDLSGGDLPNEKPTCQVDPYMHPIHAGGENLRPKNRKRQKSGLLVERTKVHRCSICLRIFPSGQALGGHKRCHWGGTGSLELNNLNSSCQKQHMEEFQRNTREELLDLNLPAPEKEEVASNLDFKVKSTSNYHMFDLKIMPTTIDRLEASNQLLRPISSGGDDYYKKFSTSFECILSNYP